MVAEGLQPGGTPSFPLKGGRGSGLLESLLRRNSMEIENEYAEWMTTGEVARRLEISVQSVHYQMKTPAARGWRWTRTPLGLLWDPASIPAKVGSETEVLIG